MLLALVRVQLLQRYKDLQGHHRDSWWRKEGGFLKLTSNLYVLVGVSFPGFFVADGLQTTPIQYVKTI